MVTSGHNVTIEDTEAMAGAINDPKLLSRMRTRTQDPQGKTLCSLAYSTTAFAPSLSKRQIEKSLDQILSGITTTVS